MAKNFNLADNPATAFLTQPAPKPTKAAKAASGKPDKAAGTNAKPVGIKPKVTKSERVQLLLEPALLEAAKEQAQAEQRSLNNLIGVALLNYLNQQAN